MKQISLPTWRALAMAGASALFVATVGLMSSSAAEPAVPQAAAPVAPGAMVRPWTQHVQAHMDRLAERLEIKASQQMAWQKFAAAFRDTAGDRAMWGQPPLAMEAPEELDAAGLARRHADRAEQHAQHLKHLADATAALQAALNADQRLVLNEVARHLAAEHGGMGPMMHGYGGDAHAAHCSPHGMEHGYGHWYGHDGEDDAGGGMHDGSRGPDMPAAPGDNAPHEPPR